jgi:flagellar hook-basal body complex protein FliE
MIAPLSGALSALGPQATIGPLTSTATSGGASAGAAGSAGSASFGSQLTNAISSLDQSQQTATADSQGLATGTISDPTQAITSVENASLAMDLASQVRDKLVSAENTIFATQV